MVKLGIVGGGQLASMLCQAAKKISVQTTVFADDKNSPAQHFADNFIYANYEAEKSLTDFANQVDFITYEFENISFETLNRLSKLCEVNPNPRINQIVQNRLSEKQFINKLGLKTVDYKFVQSLEDLNKGSALLPGILKTTRMGYDGKGQFVINSIPDIKNININFQNEYILEKKIKLKKEISIVITRYKSNQTSIYEPIENTHNNQILSESIIPSSVSEAIKATATTAAQKLTEELEYIGTMCVEFFIDNQDNLYINEIAPRVHNSGHLTINTHNVSQFENHVRAVCDLEFIPLKKIHNAKMINILGSEILKYKNKKLDANEFFFDYLKKEAKPNRKMGHLTIITD